MKAFFMLRAKSPVIGRRRSYSHHTINSYVRQIGLKLHKIGGIQNWYPSEILHIGEVLKAFWDWPEKVLYQKLHFLFSCARIIFYPNFQFTVEWTISYHQIYLVQYFRVCACAPPPPPAGKVIRKGQIKTRFLSCLSPAKISKKVLLMERSALGCLQK